MSLVYHIVALAKKNLYIHRGEKKLS